MVISGLFQTIVVIFEIRALHLRDAAIRGQAEGVSDWGMGRRLIDT